MLKRSKYTLMNIQLSKIKQKLSLAFFKLVALTLKKRQDIKEDDLVNIFGDALKMIELKAHVVYENSIDLKKISNADINKYLENNNISKQLYNVEYQEGVNNYIQILLFFALMRRDNINPQIDDLEVILKMFNGCDIQDYISELFHKLSPDSQKVIDNLFENNFEVDSLNVELKQLLNEYHSNYMNTYIYSNGCNKNFNKDQALKLTKRLLKKYKY